MHYLIELSSGNPFRTKCLVALANCLACATAALQNLALKPAEAQGVCRLAVFGDLGPSRPPSRRVIVSFGRTHGSSGASSMRSSLACAFPRYPDCQANLLWELSVELLTVGKLRNAMPTYTLMLKL